VVTTRFDRRFSIIYPSSSDLAVKYADISLGKNSCIS
jgi:hypothetical protein